MSQQGNEETECVSVYFLFCLLLQRELESLLGWGTFSTIYIICYGDTYDMNTDKVGMKN